MRVSTDVARSAGASLAPKNASCLTRNLRVERFPFPRTASCLVRAPDRVPKKTGDLTLQFVVLIQQRSDKKERERVRGTRERGGGWEREIRNRETARYDKRQR